MAITDQGHPDLSPEEYQELDRYLLAGECCIPQLSVDCVIFGAHGQQLRVLLISPKGLAEFVLPGGFVEQNTDVAEAARQTLQARTGLERVELDLFAVFGNASRNTLEAHGQYFGELGFAPERYAWLMKRFVTVGYFALVNLNAAKLKPDPFARNIDWYDPCHLPPMILDHAELVQNALETLRTRVEDKLQQARLLPPQFTMNELQRAYESILGKSLRRNNFQRRMLASGLLERTEKRFTGGAHKAPYLYRYASGELPQALTEGAE